MRAVFASFSGGSTNSPRRSRAQLQSQAYLRAFICSILALSEDVHLFLFVSPAPTQKLLNAHLSSCARVHVLSSTAASGGSRLQHGRYLNYLALLDQLEGNLSKVVLSDASDVVLQSDPFSLVQDGLYTAEEAPRYTLGTHRANTLWVRELYGAEQLRALAEHRVVCSGFTAGTVASTRQYLQAMVNESRARLGSQQLSRLRHKHGRDLSRGFDQGIHNVLVRTRLRPITTIQRSGAWPPPPIFHGNDRRCGEDVRMERNGSRLAYASSMLPLPPIVVAHQFGRVRGSCQHNVRRALTCREPRSREAWQLPAYCRICERMWPAWLGDSSNSWRVSDA
jgi:hypothetical protein